MIVHIHTYGCQMNARDSEAAQALLLRHGHRPASAEGEADAVIVNTCSVRGKAEEKALGKLGLLVARKRERPALLVGAIGCMAQRLGGELLRKVPGLDFAIGTGRIARLPAVLDLLAHGHSPVVETDGEGADGEAGGVGEHLPGGVSAFVNILYGCDRGCAYCIVPAVRGHEWSRRAAEVVAEVEKLAAAGVKDVTLLGQSVMSYGRAGEPAWPPEGPPSPRGFREPLPRLLEAVSAVPGICRIRFTSGHPSGCTEELARAMAELGPVCEHLHLPLQSGSDRILELMRRGYGRDGYRAAVERIRARVPAVAITTDIIVGFPSETEADFDDTRRFMEEVDFDNAFIFKYSPRPATPAAAWKDDVPADEKMRRNRVLLEDQERRAARHNGQLVGRELEVLAEGVSLRSAERWTGRTRTNKIAAFEPKERVGAGDLVTVRIARATAQTLYGELCR